MPVRIEDEMEKQSEFDVFTHTTTTFTHNENNQ